MDREIDVEQKLREIKRKYGGFANFELITLCNEKDQKIADLEAKLAESEKTIKNNSHNKWLKAEAERYKKEYQSLKGYVDQLKQQLAEKDAEVQNWKDGTMVVKLCKLEEQLAEKDLKIIELETKLNLKDKETNV